MIDQHTALVGTNLALALHEQRVHLTPVHGSLVSQLSQAVSHALMVQPVDEQSLQTELQRASEGHYHTSRLGQKSYEPSVHDALMDNYVPELSALITSHIAFARSVVYKKMVGFTEQMAQYCESHRPRQAEDFFVVHHWRAPEIFSSQFLSDELAITGASRSSDEVLNFGEELGEGFDLLGYVAVGDAPTDELVRQWATQEGVQKLLGYVRHSVPALQLTLHERLSYHLVNFLFYRSVAIRQDLRCGLGLVQLLAKAGASRDYHLGELRVALRLLHSALKSGQVLALHSEVAFSHLSERQFELTVYADNFDQAAAQGASIDALYGYVARHGRADLTITQLVQGREEYERAWQHARSLYASYLLKNKDYLRMEIKRVFESVLRSDRDEQQEAYEQAHSGFRDETMRRAAQYLDSLSAAQLEDLNAVAFELFARIAYRHTGAARLIGDMLELQSVNPDMDMAQAAQGAAVNYTVDFLMGQCQVTRG